MKKKGGFTLVELLVVIAVIALLMAILLPALSKARTQAKRIACLSGLKQLLTAWMTYADNHDGKLVNGGQAPPADAKETFWCTPLTPVPGPSPYPAVRYDWDIGPPMTTLQLPYEERVELLKKGALFKYCNNEKLYRCPEAEKDTHRTYIMPTTMNAAWTGYNSTLYPSSKVARRVGQIKRAVERVVFFEEKIISPDAFEFPYHTTISSLEWGPDKPNVMHGDGANFGFADGHADYHAWECEATIISARDTAHINPPTKDKVQECPEDAIWMLNAVWGLSLK